MSETYVIPELHFTKEDVEKYWPEEFGELDWRKMNLLANNLNALHQGNLTEDIKHVIQVWQECGVQ